MDFLIHRDPNGLDSTAYMEIGQGRYSGKHWQKGFLFVSEEAFAMAEGILRKHFPNYDHFGMNEIPKEIGLGILAEWQSAADALLGIATTEMATLLHLNAATRKALEQKIDGHRGAISEMLRELVAECRLFYKSEDWISILGM